jgi:CheY-like chemotaxis protein
VGGKGLILLVEDDSGIRDSLAELLESEGYAVVDARDGAEGLERLGELTPTVIVLDLHMPVMDGRQFLVHLRRDRSRCAIPVLLMTGSNPEAAARHLAVQAILPKPFELDELLEAVRRIGGEGDR